MVQLTGSNHEILEFFWTPKNPAFLNYEEEIVVTTNPS